MSGVSSVSSALIDTMSSGGWEVVGKNKKVKNNKTNKLTKAEKKKFIENAPKVEDFLPLNQVKTLYDNLDGDKENEKPPKIKENKTKENEEKKKQQRQQQQHQAEKRKREPKERLPKTIEEAINLIDSEEISNILATGQARFPDAPLTWLKDLVAFLNIKIPVERDNPVFSGQPADYPLSIMPKKIRSILENAIETAGQRTVQLFYEMVLITMVNDMIKGVPVVGYKIFLQLLAHYNPEMTIANIPKLISLKNSYQNRKPVSLSLLWALAQSGSKDLTIGLKMWHEVMAPMLEMKGYSSYVLQILNDLVSNHKDVSNLDPELYLLVVDDVYSGKLNVPAMHEKEIHSIIEKLKTITFKNRNTNYQKLFETLINKIPRTNCPYKSEILLALVKCFHADVQSYSTWRSIYAKNLFQSSLLLKYFNNNWDKEHSTWAVKELAQSLAIFQANNEEWKKAKRKEEYFGTWIKECEALQIKMTVSRSCFPWKKGSVFLLLLIGAIVAIDCRKHGSFEASSTGKFLENSGIFSYVQSTRSTIKFYWDKSLEYVEASAPEYYKIVIESSTPYLKLAADMCLVTKNIAIDIYNNIATYVAQKVPVVAANIDHYAPGLLDEISRQSINTLELIKTYSALISEQIIEHSIVLIQWLENNVFVGKLSPENLQKYASQAIDTTHTFAIRTYDWVYEKVQTLSKVQ